MTLDPRHRSSDTVTLRAPLALRLRDVSDMSLIGDDVLVTATETSPAQRSFTLLATPSGTWTAPRVPGLRPELAADPALWPPVAQPFELLVTDPRKRYLPLRIVANLPAEAPIAWPGFSSLPGRVARALLPGGRAVAGQPDFLPLFPGLARVAPSARAEVHAHLAIANGGVPAGNARFAVMTVSIGGLVRGVGVADASGAILVSFPYPLLPTPTPAERAAGTTRFEWKATIAVFCAQLPQREDGLPPLLDDILAQLTRAPARVLRRLGGLAPLPEQTLRVGQPLVLRSARAAPDKPSSLFLIPA